ncbi:MAG TPA: AMP-binding protein [Candidatus Binatia bacterium]|jgi:long-chain acyl-CoA synthetase|nr:AMP-binding protein [Candidatus Binatia bacterium]
MNVAEVILAGGQDSAVAVLHRDTALTYGQLRGAVARLAGGLLARGHRKGDRVGILSENNPFFVRAYLGVIRAGLVAVPLQTDLTAEAFARIISDAGINEMFVSNRMLGRMRPWAHPVGLTFLPESQEEEFMGHPLSGPAAATGAGNLAALMFTSGSTGSPKGVMITHRNIECNSRDIIAFLGLSSTDRVMVVLPFHYCFGLSLLHTHLMAGGSVVLNNEFRLFPESVLVEIQEQECTGLAGVPSTYQILLRNSRFRQMTFPKLRLFQQAGGKLPNPCIREILDAFPTTRFFLMYGQTEATARLSYLPPARLAGKLGSVGKGLPSTRLEVLGADGAPVAPGSDEIGEIVASGDNIALGYWNDPVETAKFFRNGRLHTGDLARVDADGFVFIVEREREMIKSGGNRVSAKEVEDVIAEIPEIIEVAVVGAPHELLGEAINAVVVPMRGASITPEDVLAHCRKRLPASKTPEEIIFVGDLPHSSSGKIQKSRLKEMLGRRQLSPCPRDGWPPSKRPPTSFQRCLV